MGAANKVERRRRAMLAKIHMAKKDLALDDDTYRDFLEAEYGVRSAGKLTPYQLDQVLGIFRAWGWESDPKRQAAALRARAREMAGRIDNGEARLKGLVRKVCGVEWLDWVRDVGKLERLLAALGRLRGGNEEKEEGVGWSWCAGLLRPPRQANSFRKPFYPPRPGAPAAAPLDPSRSGFHPKTPQENPRLLDMLGQTGD